MREVYIVDAVRTPVGRMGGTLKNTQAHEMGGLVCKALMERTGLAPELVEEVVIAQVKQNAVASNIARVCALMAGFREEIPAYTLMMQCGSSLQSVNCAANDIRCGDVDVAVAGGGRRCGGHERHPLRAVERPVRLRHRQQRAGGSHRGGG